MAEHPLWQYPAAAAQLAVREGVDLDTAYTAMAALGMTATRETFSRLYTQAQIAAGMVDATSELGMDTLPAADSIQTRSTVTSTGYLYQFSVTAVDTESGEEFQIPYSIKTSQLITPAEGIDAAIISQTIRGAEYNHQVTGAQLTGVFQLVPGELT